MPLFCWWTWQIKFIIICYRLIVFGHFVYVFSSALICILLSDFGYGFVVVADHSFHFHHSFILVKVFMNDTQNTWKTRGPAFQLIYRNHVFFFFFFWCNINKCCTIWQREMTNRRFLLVHNFIIRIRIDRERFFSTLLLLGNY